MTSNLVSGGLCGWCGEGRFVVGVKVKHSTKHGIEKMEEVE